MPLFAFLLTSPCLLPSTFHAHGRPAHGPHAHARHTVRRSAPTIALARPPPNVNLPFSAEEDAFLWEHRDTSVDELASTLGRGGGGIEARLKRLRDPSTEGHRRLFGTLVEDEVTRSGLRPVHEVVQRILWDPALDASSFVIGYRDRFKAAAVEAPVDAPNENIKGSARLLVLALPQHRIMYVKYKRRLVWHKEQRLDLVFGSGEGSEGARIQDVIRGYAEWNASRAAHARRAKSRAIACLGGRAQFDEVLQLLAAARDGELAAESLIETVLADSYFGPSGGADALADSAEKSPLIDVLELLPDEHAELRSSLLEAAARRMQPDAPTATASAGGDLPATNDAPLVASAAVRRSMTPVAAVPRSVPLMCEEDRESSLRTTLLERQRVAEERGRFVLGLVLLGIVWAFSLPPELRRAAICSSQDELNDFFARFGGCISTSELLGRVAEHYQTCGASGVPCFRLDLSVDPKSSTFFYESLETLRGNIGL